MKVEVIESSLWSKYTILFILVLLLSKKALVLQLNCDSKSYFATRSKDRDCRDSLNLISSFVMVCLAHTYFACSDIPRNTTQINHC